MDVNRQASKLEWSLSFNSLPVLGPKIRCLKNIHTCIIPKSRMILNLKQFFPIREKKKKGISFYEIILSSRD